MIKNIQVVNRFRMDLTIRDMYPTPKNPFAVISIYSVPVEELMTDKAIESLKNRGCVDTLSLLFQDGSPEDEWMQYPFNLTHAKEVRNFLDNLNAMKENIFLIVHCDAGISRSGAVATFAANYLEINFKDDLIRPNPHVLSMLNRQIWDEKYQN